MPQKRTYEELERRVKELEQEFERRKQAEKALRETEDKYSSLANNLNVGLYRNTVGPNGKFLEANPAIVEMFGYDSKEQFLKVSVSDLYKNPDDRKNYNAKLIQEGAVRNEELELQKKDGTSFIGSISAVVVQDEKGVIRYYDGIIEDITEPKRVVEKLRKSEERFRNVYETAPLAFVVWDKNTHVTDWNKKAEEIFKWSKEEAVDKNFFDFLTPEKDRPEVEDIVSSLLKGTLVRHSINENLTKEGKIITCEWNNSAFHDSDGNIIGAISLGLEITDRIRAEEALRESEEKYRTILETIPDPVVAYNSQHKITYINEAFESTYGWSKNELINREIDFVPPEELENTKEAWRRTLVGEKVFFETRRRTKDGRFLNIQLRTAILNDQFGNHLVSIVIHRDVTVLKQAEYERDQLISKLQQALGEVKKLSGLIPICSHCKQIRDDKGYWSQIESYISAHSEALFSHGICPDCAKKLYPEFDLYPEEK